MLSEFQFVFLLDIEKTPGVNALFAEGASWLCWAEPLGTAGSLPAQGAEMSLSPGAAVSSPLLYLGGTLSKLVQCPWQKG